jgi:phosphoribosylaminoimidazole carboxylase (NCAIR synthetase)
VFCSAATTEFENVPAGALMHLSEFCAVAPGGHAVAIAQDRMAETVHTLATLLAAKDAEIARLRGLAFPHEKKDIPMSNGGAAA